MSVHPIKQTAIDVARHPVGSEHEVSAAWLENESPAADEVTAKIELDVELVMYRSMRKVIDVEEGEIWAAGYRKGDEVWFRIRDMTETPKGVVQIIAILINELGEKLNETFRYTFTTHHFKDMDLYKVHATTSLIEGEPGDIRPKTITNKIKD